MSRRTVKRSLLVNCTSEQMQVESGKKKLAEHFKNELATTLICEQTFG
jgi:hypothetical protein